MTKEAEIHFLSQLRKGDFSLEDAHVIRAWINDMEMKGPEYVQNSSRWDDHPLNYEQSDSPSQL